MTTNRKIISIPLPPPIEDPLFMIESVTTREYPNKPVQIPLYLARDFFVIQQLRIPRQLDYIPETATDPGSGQFSKYSMNLNVLLRAMVLGQEIDMDVIRRWISTLSNINDSKLYISEDGDVAVVSEGNVLLPEEYIKVVNAINFALIASTGASFTDEDVASVQALSYETLSGQQVSGESGAHVTLTKVQYNQRTLTVTKTDFSSWLNTFNLFRGYTSGLTTFTRDQYHQFLFSIHMLHSGMKPEMQALPPPNGIIAVEHTVFPNMIMPYVYQGMNYVQKCLPSAYTRFIAPLYFAGVFAVLTTNVPNQTPSSTQTPTLYAPRKNTYYTNNGPGYVTRTAINQRKLSARK